MLVYGVLANGLARMPDTEKSEYGTCVRPQEDGMSRITAKAADSGRDLSVSTTMELYLYLPVANDGLRSHEHSMQYGILVSLCPSHR